MMRRRINHIVCYVFAMFCVFWLCGGRRFLGSGWPLGALKPSPILFKMFLKPTWATQTPKTYDLPNVETYKNMAKTYRRYLPGFCLKALTQGHPRPPKAIQGPPRPPEATPDHYKRIKGITHVATEPERDNDIEPDPLERVSGPTSAGKRPKNK